MPGNSFGTLLKLSTFGESHGPAIGGILDGFPAGVKIDGEFIQAELDRRRPGQSKIVTQRKEVDRLQILSGVYNGLSTGTSIGFIIENENQRSTDYSHLEKAFRPSHADFTYEEKYGIRDHRGGGRSSARETAIRVAAGAFAKLLLQQATGVSVQAYVHSVGAIALERSWEELDLTNTENNIVRCPDPQKAEEMIGLIEKIRKAGDTIGGTIVCVAQKVPAGWGEPVFDRLHADLGKAMLSINAVKGFEYGSGFEGTLLKGSEHNDLFTQDKGKISTLTNRSGGIQGGISNGQPIYFKVAFKPVATIMQKQETVNREGESVELAGKGRHDPCVLPRAVPIVEAMTALVLADYYLRNKSSRI